MNWGGFHAECIFMSVISERFLDGGRKDLVIEARLLKEGSIVSLLSSLHYDKAMRIHEYVYEDEDSFMRCKTQSFEEWLGW